MESKLIQLKVVGLFPCDPYQRAKYYAIYLHENLSELYAYPILRPMFDVQWTEFLTKCRRNLGIRLWMLNVPVAVFRNNEFFGDDDDLLKFCSNEYGFHVFDNFTKTGEFELQKYITTCERNHVYFIISIDSMVVGTILFQLYNDLVPLTCANFLRLLHRRRRGYNGAPIHRVARTGWIQIGGHNLKRQSLPCENYYVHHDRRGVISMCHGGKHRKNSKQFFITLQPSSWMDYYYVAFGQVLHGEDILQKIENTPSHYDIPEVPIRIEDCGEYTFLREPDPKFFQQHQVYLSNEHDYLRSTKKDKLLALAAKRSELKQVTMIEPEPAPKLKEVEVDVLFKNEEKFKAYPDDISDFRDIDSNMSERRYNNDLYCINSRVTTSTLSNV